MSACPVVFILSITSSGGVSCRCDASLYTHRRIEARMLFILISIRNLPKPLSISIHILFATANARNLTTEMPTSLRYGEQITYRIDYQDLFWHVNLAI